MPRGAQREYTASIQDIGDRLGVQVQIDAKPIHTKEAANQLIAELQANQPDGLLLVMFYNRSIAIADQILAATEQAEIPAIFYIGLGVKHGPIDNYHRQGLYFIQSLDNIEAIESGIRMVHARKQMGQARLLSVTEATGTSRRCRKVLRYHGSRDPVQSLRRLFQPGQN